MSELQMITQEELSVLLNVSINNITMFREIGLIKAIRTGKCYMFSQEEIRQFQRDYCGLDVSNKVMAIKSYEEVQKKKADAGTSTQS